jgi:hypothetical protein
MVSIPVQSQIEARRINSMPRALEIPLSTAKAAKGDYGRDKGGQLTSVLVFKTVVRRSAVKTASHPCAVRNDGI